MRSATSRAYYAAFNIAAQWLRQHYPTHPLPSHGEIHQGVSDFFLFHQDVEFRVVGETLSDMRQARNLVDYRLRVPDAFKTARRNLFDANRVLNALAGLESSSQTRN